MNSQLRTLFAAHNGVACFRQLNALLTRREMRRMLGNRQLTKVLPGIYALGSPDRRILLSALDLLCGKPVVACLSTAAAVFGFDTEDVAELHVLNPDGNRLRARPGLVVHRRHGAPVITFHGRPVTEPSWTAVEVACSLPRPRALATLDAALRSKTCDRAGLEAAADAQRDETLEAKTWRLQEVHDAAGNALDRARRITELLRASQQLRSATLLQWQQLGRRSLFDVMAAEAEHYNLRIAEVNARHDGQQMNALLLSLGRGLRDWLN